MNTEKIYTKDPFDIASLAIYISVINYHSDTYYYDVRKKITVAYLWQSVLQVWEWEI